MIDFVNTDTSEIKREVIATYEALTGTTLARAAPVRLFLEALADIIVHQRVKINHAANMNLVDYSTGKFLDALGVLVGCYRLGASKAKTTLLVELSAVRPNGIFIPKGTRVATADNIMFATDEDLLIPSGTTSLEIPATCLNEGDVGNGYAPGEISNIVDPIAYVAIMTNTTTSEGGADTESDVSLRERIRTAPEYFSTAGPHGAYEERTKSVSALIGDVSAIGHMELKDIPAGDVWVYVLMNDGSLPNKEMQDMILEALNDRSIRPLTDHVFIKVPTIEKFNVNVVFYIDNEDSTKANAIRNNVNEAVSNWVLWQKQKMGRDINPSRLIQKIIQAGAKRAEIIEPVFKRLSGQSVAIADKITVTYGGLEDE